MHSERQRPCPPAIQLVSQPPGRKPGSDTPVGTQTSAVGLVQESSHRLPLLSSGTSSRGTQLPPPLSAQQAANVTGSSVGMSDAPSPHTPLDSPVNGS